MQYKSCIATNIYDIKLLLGYCTNCISTKT